MDNLLRDTIEQMVSENYDERFIAEYHQLKIRLAKLVLFLEKYKNGELDFTPKCSYDLLQGQRKAMELYLSFLDERAEIEKIDL